MKVKNVEDEARNLSRATITVISGLRKEFLQAIVRQQFGDFCKTNQYRSWADAWSIFWPKFKATELYQQIIDTEKQSEIRTDSRTFQKQIPAAYWPRLDQEDKSG